MSSGTYISVTQRGRYITEIGLDRPHKLNAINEPMRKELVQALQDCQLSQDTRVIVLRGQGKSFSVGADTSDAGLPESTEGARSALLDTWFDTYLAVWDSPKPIISEVHGYCMGVAIVLAACSDLVMVAEDAKIRWPAVPLGGGVLGPSLVWHIGPHRAKEFSFQVGSEMSGVEAAAYGFANRAVDGDKLREAVLDLSESIARIPSDLLRMKKEAINSVQEQMGFRHSLRTSASWAALAGTTEAAHETRGLVRQVGIKEAVRRFSRDKGGRNE